MLTSMLEAGEWRVEGGELVVQVAASATVIEMSLGADAAGWRLPQPAAYWAAQ